MEKQSQHIPVSYFKLGPTAPTSGTQPSLFFTYLFSFASFGQGYLNSTSQLLRLDNPINFLNSDVGSPTKTVTGKMLETGPTVYHP